MKTLICDCNHTMPLDAPALQRALQQTAGSSPDGLDTVHTLLCRREAGAFQRAAKVTGSAAEDLVVACTQERRLFLELNAQTEGAAPLDVRPIRFVNIRETGGWSRDARGATPKIAALLAAAQLPTPQAVPHVGYRSGGRCLILGPAEDAERAAALLADKLDINLLVEGTAGAGVQQAHQWAVHNGRLLHLKGWLGAFDAAWESSNPIDLELCTRCNACIDVCPEGAIDFSYQVDLAACKSHRDCVRVCEAAGAIDFQRAPQTVNEAFDLVLDLRAHSAFAMHQPPQGYFHVGSDATALAKATIELRDAVGEFEKPKFFNYNQKICAHSRNEQIGCTACIDVCSAQAISSDASLKGKTQGKPRRGPGGATGALKPTGGIVVEPHLCVGCGACSTVCPSGAISFAYPNAVEQGQRLRTLLRAYANAGGRDPVLLIHSDGEGTRRIDQLGRAARTDRQIHGVPARVLPLGVWHTASVGLDLWLAAIAQGANQVWVLLTGEEAPQYRQALDEQTALAQAVLQGLGYSGRHFKLIESRAARDLAALDAELREGPASGVAKAAGFNAQADKRATLDLALDHLLTHAPKATDAIALPAAGAPFGSLRVNTDTCTMCLSCIGACPEGALLDNPDRPQLRFIENNCVQCGLCATTCPEHAITLEPRLWLADAGKARKAARVLHEVEPFCCVRCGKPFGTLRAIETMIGKLAGHAAFQGAAAERLKMCSDCRVIDLHSNPNEVRITDL
jgi:ferredoxin